MLLHDAFVRKAMEHPDALALVSAGARTSYREINQRSDALAASLIKDGVARGDRVVVFMDNSVAAVVALYGILKSGAVMVPVNPLTKSDKLAFILKDAEAAAFVGDSHLRSVYETAWETYRPSIVIVNGGDKRDTGAVPAYWTRWRRPARVRRWPRLIRILPRSSIHRAPQARPRASC